MAREHGAQLSAIDEALETTARFATRRMMNEHHAKRVAAAREQLRELCKLHAAEPPGRHERRSRDCAREADQRDAVAPTQERKGHLPVVAAHELAPVG